MSGPGPAARSRHWRGNLRLTWALLVLWCVVSFVVPYFARDLTFTFFGWPFGFWMAAQGAMLVYLLIVGLYAARLRRLDEDLEASEGDDVLGDPDG